ncbi:MAG: gliding motility-associated C-terminal domain-containing protein [Spirochaetaceae bacterium]|jgi:flagellar hook assembly protein FlgD/outer membrane protein OmpA-like peptidoglycan-associated protein|nr:gliding motility-associated C-terminal domain-containing protein [Spirochaetaceae bacterium]
MKKTALYALAALTLSVFSAAALFAQQGGTVKYISPNNDGLQDYLIVNFSIKEKRYITEWHLFVTDSRGYRVRTINNKDDRPQAMGFVTFWKTLFSPKRSVPVPRFVSWDGRDELGETVPDGFYTYYMSAVNDNGVSSESARYTVVVDCTPPHVTLRPPQEQDKFFGAGAKAELRIGQSGDTLNMDTDVWTGVFADAQGKPCKTFRWAHNPQDLRWDGTNDDGLPVPDGLYFYSLTGTDRAGNRSLPARVNNIVYSGDKPQVNITISGSRYFSNNPESPRKSVTLVPSIPNPRAGNTLQGWKIELVDNSGRGKVVQTWSEAAGVPPPASITLSGGADGKRLADGVYVARVSASYLNGYAATPVPSPLFFLKSAPPSGTVSVREPKNRVFSPGSGEGRDHIIFDESLELTNTVWKAEIRGRDGRLIRAFERGAGGAKGALPNLWDGFDEQGKLCADGEYLYTVATTDLSGNTSRVMPVSFSIDTQKTELMLRMPSQAFSPNGDGIQDTISIIPLIKSSGLERYKLEISNNEMRVVKTIAGPGSPDAAIIWDGRDDNGNLAADNRYVAMLTVVSRNSNNPIIAKTAPFLLKNRAPSVSVSAAPYATTFSPDGDGLKDTLPLEIQTSAEDLWTAVISDKNGSPVWQKNWFSTNVPSFEWDGTDESGNIAPDGIYTFSLAAKDAAGNSAAARLTPITLDRRPTTAVLAVAHDYLAPNGKNKSQSFPLTLSVRDGVQSWAFQIRQAGDKKTPPIVQAGNGDTIPAKFEWDGRLASGEIAEGEFAADFSVVYWKGNQVRAESASFICTGNAPQTAVTTNPEFFSPDNDGVEDELYINLKARSLLPLASWSFTIYDYSPNPNEKGKPFWTIAGKSQVTGQTVWNGRSNTGKAASGAAGELVQSATDYPYSFTVTDVEGQTTTVEGSITVDILVIRDGDLLRIQVPAITFRGNAADFNGLAADVMSRNTWILGRISRALGRFKEYTVLIEGHANPVLGTAQEEAELLTLSRERAEFVRAQLARLGVSAGRLSVMGVGAARPMPGVSPRDSANNWKNRRVEFILNK